MNSIEGAKFGQTIESGNRSKRYEIIIQAEDYHKMLKGHKHSTVIPDTEPVIHKMQ